ncbi:hypothetical protein ACHAPJ_011393 [Fusarium lateritium]
MKSTGSGFRRIREHLPSIRVLAAWIVFWRTIIEFLDGALAVGILVPYNDPVLKAVYQEGTGHSGSAAAFSYIISMKNLRIGVLTHIIAALIATAIFSAGKTSVYCATRSLYGVAIEGRAPRFLRYVTKE